MKKPEERKRDWTVNPVMAELPFRKFEAWHKKKLSNDVLSAEERYKKIGGKMPKESTGKK